MPTRPERSQLGGERRVSLAVVDRILSGFKGEPGELIPVLQAVQSRIGYLPEDALRLIAHHCHVAESSVFGVVTFYEQFHLRRQGSHVIKVCRGTGCHVRGSARIMRALEKKLGIRAGETTPDYSFTLERVACFGACALSPVVMVSGRIYAHMTPAKALKLVEKLK